MKDLEEELEELEKELEELENRELSILLTLGEITTIQYALETHIDHLFNELACSAQPEASKDAHGSALWCWQKLEGIRNDFRNAMANLPAGEKAVDPFDLRGLEY
jgi:chromosome segregation ATPase